MYIYNIICIIYVHIINIHIPLLYQMMISDIKL